MISASCRITTDAVSDRVDETQSHAQPVVVQDACKLTR